MPAINIDLEGAKATETTPLSPRAGLSPVVPASHSRLKQRVVASICFVVISSILALFVSRSHYFTSGNFIRFFEGCIDVVESDRLPLHSPSSPTLFGRTDNDEAFSSKREPVLRWGILGPGRIAHDFTSVLIVSGCNVTAVAASHDDEVSSAISRAQTFAELFSIPNYYGSYEELASDPNVDIVYVATTNQNHMKPTLMMLEAGKNVLVEKPTTVTYREAKMMYDEANVRVLGAINISSNDLPDLPSA